MLGDYPAAPWAQIGVGDSRTPIQSGIWDVSHWDTDGDRWSGVEPTWLDRSCEGIAVQSMAGRPRIGDPFDVGTAELTFRNLDGWGDMQAPIDPAALVLRPGRAIRYGVDTPTGRHILFRGFVDDAIPVYAPYATDVVGLACIDALGEAGRVKVAPVDPPVGAGETASARAARVLDAVGWPTSKRDINTASTRLVATGLGADALDLLTLAADSCGGAVFGDLAGNVAFRMRDWQTFVPGPPDATVGNVDAGDVCPQGWELSFRRRETAVVARMGRTVDEVVVVVDEAAMPALGAETYERVDLATMSDGDLYRLALRILRVRGMATMPRVEAVVLDAATDPGDGRVVELMATARPETPTRLRCRLVTKTGRAVFDAEYFVASAEHTITENGRWTCRLGLDLAAPFAAAGGRWDLAGWDRATWTATAP